MTKAATKVGDVFFPGAGTVAREGSEAAMKQLKPGDPGAPKDLPTRGGPADPEIEKRVTEQFATRKQAIGAAAAAAAGAQRSENEADLLGYTTPKRRAASRTLLGGR